MNWFEPRKHILNFHFFLNFIQKCRTIELSDYRVVELSDYRVVGLSSCRTIELSDYRAVGLSIRTPQINRLNDKQNGIRIHNFNNTSPFYMTIRKELIIRNLRKGWRSWMTPASLVTDFWTGPLDTEKKTHIHVHSVYYKCHLQNVC